MGMRLADIIITLLLIVDFSMVMLCVFLPYWQENDQSLTVRDDIRRHQGLWLRCTSHTSGNWDCDDFNRFILGLPGYLQAARGLGILAAATSLASVIAMIIGCECNKMASFIKRRSRIVAGACSIGAGICIVIAVSIYAHRVLTLYWEATPTNPFQRSNTNRNVFGSSLFVGWAAGALHLIIGVVGICLACCSREEPEYPTSYAYRPSQPAHISNKEYV